jgi:hypothetical protein
MNKLAYRCLRHTPLISTTCHGDLLDMSYNNCPLDVLPFRCVALHAELYTFCTNTLGVGISYWSEKRAESLAGVLAQTMRSEAMATKPIAYLIRDRRRGHCTNSIAYQTAIEASGNGHEASR